MGYSLQIISSYMIALAILDSHVCTDAINYGKYTQTILHYL